MKTLCILLALAAPARADWHTFLFSTDAQSLDARQAAVESGAGFNGLPQDKVVLPADQRRVDTWLGAAVGITRRLSLEGAVAFADGPERPYGFGYGRAELKLTVLRARPKLPLSIAVGGGYQVDAAVEHAVTAVVATTLELGRVLVTVNVRAAHYFHDGRDPLDVMLAAGASVRTTSWLRLGLEYVGEELEGAADGAEIEVGQGGRHYVGPSAQLQLANGRLRVNATAGPVVTARSTSGLARAAVSYLF